MVERKNLCLAWIWIFLGCMAGAVMGMFFHNEEWLGGYGSWSRRMLRLAHISFFGTAFINLAFALSVSYFKMSEGLMWPSRLFIAGAVGMPLICYLSAVHPAFRHLFFIPALSIIIGIAAFNWRMLFK